VIDRRRRRNLVPVFLTGVRTAVELEVGVKFGADPIRRHDADERVVGYEAPFGHFRGMLHIQIDAQRINARHGQLRCLGQRPTDQTQRNRNKNHSLSRHIRAEGLVGQSQFLWTRRILLSVVLRSKHDHALRGLQRLHRIRVFVAVVHAQNVQSIAAHRCAVNGQSVERFRRRNLITIRHQPPRNLTHIIDHTYIIDQIAGQTTQSGS